MKKEFKNYFKTQKLSLILSILMIAIYIALINKLNLKENFINFILVYVIIPAVFGLLGLFLKRNFNKKNESKTSIK